MTTHWISGDKKRGGFFVRKDGPNFWLGHRSQDGDNTHEIRIKEHQYRLLAGPVTPFKFVPGQTALLYPVKISELVNCGLYVVEAKKNKKFPRLGRTPYWTYWFSFKDPELPPSFYGSGVNLGPEEVKGVWRAV